MNSSSICNLSFILTPMSVHYCSPEYRIYLRSTTGSQYEIIVHFLGLLFSLRYIYYMYEELVRIIILLTVVRA